MQKVSQKFTVNMLLIFLFFIGKISAFSQNSIPVKPMLETSVYDKAGMLSIAQKNALEQKLIKYHDTTSTQIVVATINSLNNKNIALYATEWAHKWGIGDKGKDNGVFLLVAKNDRKVTIRTGYGVEHKLTDAFSRRIIEQVITPQFKKGQYYKGLDLGTTYIIKVLNGEFQNDSKQNTNDNEIPTGLIIFIIIVLFLILSNRNKGNRGYQSSTGSLLDIIILSNSGRGGGFSGGFGGSSSGGGFSGGFGGGGFGGGGASGGW